MSGVTARLSMWFSETVDPTTFNKKELVLQSGETSGAQYKLKGGTPTTAAEPYMHIDLDKKDLDAIKLLPSLANSKNGTFLVFADELVTDMATVANKIVAAPASGALQAKKYAADVTEPELLSFNLNMSSEVLSMTFSEPILAKSITSLSVSGGYRGITLASACNVPTDMAQCSGTNPCIQLSMDGTLLSTNGLVVTFQLSTGDGELIKSKAGLATTSDNTFIALQPKTVLDMALVPNGNSATTDCAGNGVAVFADDSVPPVLERFESTWPPQNCTWSSLR